jgi:hypothetical protein
MDRHRTKECLCSSDVKILSKRFREKTALVHEEQFLFQTSFTIGYLLLYTKFLDIGRAINCYVPVDSVNSNPDACSAIYACTCTSV